MTPAHDPNDFEVGKRHDLEIINILNDDGTLNENTGKYKGKTCLNARNEIVEELKNMGLVDKIEPHMHNVGSCYRCHTTVEPYMSTQWFVKMKELAEPAIEAVKNEEINFVPKRFEKTYFNWMENIQDWCISRQLWWGHRIPAYTCDKCGKLIVSNTKIIDCKCGGVFHQDQDTLDTWFSSALWPFSTLGWPKDTEEYEYFYPTTMLVTAYDIINFWVSKMIFSGIAYTGKIPFKDVYIHGLVKDSTGRKMSKSLGNGVDPLDVIEKFGTDALRFSLIQNISLGNDMRYIPEKVEASRNFSNKIWNAARFIKMYIDELPKDFEPEFFPEDKWILNSLSDTITKTTECIDKYEIGVSAQIIYDFIWSDFCDWYIEMVKHRLYGEKDKSYFTAVWTLKYVFRATMILLHPYMPYITEEIYLELDGTEESIMIEKWPQAKYNFEEESRYVVRIMDIIRQIRNLRVESDIAASKKINAYVYITNDIYKEIFKMSQNHIKRLAILKNIEFIESNIDIDKTFVAIHSEDLEIYLDLSSAIDIETEAKKLNDEKNKILAELKRAKGMLSNSSFVDRAPSELVEKEKEKIIKYEELLEKTQTRLEQLITR